MIVALTIAAFGSLAALVTHASRDRRSEEAIRAIKTCPGCRQIVTRSSHTCRHCGAALPMDKDPHVAR